MTRTAFIALIAICTLSGLLMANEGNSQERLSEIKVTLRADNASLPQVLRKIEAQTQFTFSWFEGLELRRNIDIHVKDEPLDRVLKTLANTSSVTFRRLNGLIAVNQAIAAESAMDDGVITLMQVRGKVTEDGTPLPGVNVREKGTTNGTVTDIDGNYTLDVAEDGILIFSFIGYTTQEVSVGNATVIDIIMEENIATLYEATVISNGYQTLPATRSSGAFGYIGEQEIQNRPSTNLSAVMEGMFSGVRVSEEDGFTIRGIGTMLASAAPLIVVDGFPVADGLQSINPNNVASVNVLKDAAAASIWGARAANGVIVITTKSPEKGLKISMNAFTSIQSEFDLDHYNPVANSETALAWEEFLWDNDQKFASFSLSEDVDGNNNTATQGVALLHQRDEGIITSGEFDQAWAQLQQTDYRDDVYEYMLQNPVTQNYDITISGTGEKNEFILNTRYIDTKENVVGDHSKSFLTNFRSTFELTPWMEANVGLMTKFTRGERSNASLSDFRDLSPYERIIEEDGSYAKMVGAHYQGFIDNVDGIFPENWDYNLLQESRETELTSEDNDVRIQLGLKFDILKGLSFESKFQFEQFKGESRNYYSKDSYFVRDQRNKWVEYDEGAQQILKEFVPEGGQLDHAFSTTRSYTYRNQFNYDRSFSERHQITASFITELSTAETETYGAPLIYGYDPDKLTSEVPGAYFPVTSYWGGNNYTLGGAESSLTYINDRYFSAAGNVAYTYNYKYSLTGSIRTDASNLIVEDPAERYSPFWSVGGNWQLSEEDFMSNISFVDRLSLRLSHGRSGNVVTKSSTVPLITLYGVYPLTGATYGAINDFGNPTLTWEKTTTTNFGIDYSLFGDKLFGAIELYKKHGKDILGAIDLPRLTGTTTQVFNTAEIINKGIELNVNTIQPITAEVSWNSRLNLSFNTSEVLSLQILDYSYSALQNPHFEEGRPVDAIYSYQYLGMNGDGDPYMQGIEETTFTFNENRPATIDDREFMEYSGSTEPTTLLGWQNGFSAYGFSLSAMVTGEFGHVFRRPTFDYSILYNNKWSSTIHRDAEQVLNGTAVDIPTMPAADVSNLPGWGGYAQYLNTTMEDAASIRIKEINLAYTLPSHITSKIGSSNVRVYFQIRDPQIIWVANDEGLDPYYIYNGTPLVKPATSYLFGVQLDF